MSLNKYVWSLFRESKSAQQTIDDYAGTLDSYRQEFGLDEYTVPIPDEHKAESGTDTVSFSIIQTVHDYYSQYAVNNIDEAVQKYDEMVTNGIPIAVPGNPEIDSVRFGDKGYELEWYGHIEKVALGLYFACPEFFIPHFFTRFYLLEEICARFNIPLPSLPLKKDKLGKALYFGQLVRSFYEFRRLHNLSPTEMRAFLYDFGLNVIEQDESEELPKPSKVWLLKGGVVIMNYVHPQVRKWVAAQPRWAVPVSRRPMRLACYPEGVIFGADNGDFEFLEEATESTVASCWGGNIEIRKGDILLMYVRSPQSCIHSIWRAIADGFADPFFHFHYAVSIGSMVKTKPVTFREMKNDPILSQKGLIRANLQGPSGSAFSVKEYNAVLSIMERKGQDISLLPKLEPASYPDSTDINNERDVEKFLVEPLLEKLGYTKDDWIRQMSIKMGRGERNYPDYAFGANPKWGEESAKMVLEAKYRLSTHRELKEAFYQAKSYALRLQAKLLVLCAREGVWIFKYKRNKFNFDDFVHKNWSELSHPDTLHKTLLIIGKKKVKI